MSLQERSHLFVLRMHINHEVFQTSHRIHEQIKLGTELAQLDGLVLSNHCAQTLEVIYSHLCTSLLRLNLLEVVVESGTCPETDVVILRFDLAGAYGETKFQITSFLVEVLSDKLLSSKVFHIFHWLALLLQFLVGNNQKIVLFDGSKTLVGQVPLTRSVFFLRVLVKQEVNCLLDACVGPINFEPGLEGSSHTAKLLFRLLCSESPKLSQLRFRKPSLFRLQESLNLPQKSRPPGITELIVVSESHR